MIEEETGYLNTHAHIQYSDIKEQCVSESKIKY